MARVEKQKTVRQKNIWIAMTENQALAKEIVSGLKRQGVQTVCLCAGARNAALIEAFTRDADIETLFFVDERSASFYALGKARESNQYVAVCTTSGTAVAELLPAMIEAFYVNARVVMLTADRPRRFRGSGAPQAIDQTQFLKTHTHYFFDLQSGSENFELPKAGPTHINVCFEEPVLGNPSQETQYPAVCQESRMGISPLVLVGELTKTEAETVNQFLRQQPAVVVLEAHSGVLPKNLHSQSFMVDGSSIHVDNFKKYFDCVIRIGGIPTLRLWRDLDEKLRDVPVINFSSRNFSGLARIKSGVFPVEEVVQAHWTLNANNLKSLNETQKSLELKKVQLEEMYPSSELSLIQKLSNVIPQNSMVMLANSLPIREWDLVADKNKKLQVVSQRGVNGIDGLVTTFFGRLQKDRDNVLVIGDLSMVYDANSYWVYLQSLNRLKQFSFKIIVVNNFGGRIFRRMFTQQEMQTPHDQNFRALASTFDLPYSEWKNVDDIHWNLPSQCIVEIQPDLTQSDSSWTWINEISK